MLAYVRELSGTGGWVAESLKHLSFLLASPCGAQIGYFLLLYASTAQEAFWGFST